MRNLESCLLGRRWQLRPHLACILRLRSPLACPSIRSHVMMCQKDNNSALERLCQQHAHLALHLSSSTIVDGSSLLLFG